LPVFAHITEGKIHEVKVAQTMILPSGSIVAIDTQALINSRKATQEAKEAAQQRLIESERLTALGAMAAGISHEPESVTPI